MDITPQTRFSNIQKMYPDAIRIKGTSAALINKEQAASMLFEKGIEPICLQALVRLVKKGWQWQYVFIKQK